MFEKLFFYRTIAMQKMHGFSRGSDIVVEAKQLLLDIALQVALLNDIS